ncbi:MAG: hypothetical protein CK429_04160 [Mycobacterium sp.]|nr:MAG: hypothetical protein CK429_04160 [Mycobacterium sp.]
MKPSDTVGFPVHQVRSRDTVQAHQAFDLNREPCPRWTLFRMSLVRRGETERPLAEALLTADAIDGSRKIEVVFFGFFVFGNTAIQNLTMGN